MKTDLDRSPGLNHSPSIIRPSLLRGLFLALLLAMPSGVPCPAAHSETTNMLLTLYIVADKQIEGGRFFDAFPFPKLGYIASRPDFVIALLAEVNLEEKPDSLGALRLTNGETKRIVAHHAPRLFVTLLPEDANRVNMLGAAIPGRRVLILAGETPIGLARVSDLAGNPTFHVPYNWRNETSTRKLADDLSRMVLTPLDGIEKRLNDRKTWIDQRHF